MTTFEHRMMLILAHGETPSHELYEHAKDDTRVRRNLRLLIERGWVVLSKKEKIGDGPGRPTNFYKLTEQGVIILHNHEEQLEELRG